MSNKLTFEFEWRSYNDGEWFTKLRVLRSDKSVSENIYIDLKIDKERTHLWLAQINDSFREHPVEGRHISSDFQTAKQIGQKMAIMYWTKRNMERLLANAIATGDLV